MASPLRGVASAVRFPLLREALTAEMLVQFREGRGAAITSKRDQTVYGGLV